MRLRHSFMRLVHSAGSLISTKLMCSPSQTVCIAATTSSERATIRKRLGACSPSFARKDMHESIAASSLASGSSSFSCVVSMLQLLPRLEAWAGKQSRPLVTKLPYRFILPTFFARLLTVSSLCALPRVTGSGLGAILGIWVKERREMEREEAPSPERRSQVGRSPVRKMVF